MNTATAGLRIAKAGAATTGGKSPSNRSMKVEDRRVADGRYFARKYALVPASDLLRKLIAKYLRIARLDYGAFDIFETSDGYYFLECNPEGQWFAANNNNLDEVVEAFCNLIIGRMGKHSSREDRHSEQRII